MCLARAALVLWVREMIVVVTVAVEALRLRPLQTASAPAMVRVGHREIRVHVVVLVVRLWLCHERG